MRLVLATPLYPPEIGGPATYASLLFSMLPSRGVEVELVKFGDVRHLPKIVRHIAYFWRVLKAARRADVVLALDPVSTGLPALLAAKIARRPFIVKIVGDYAWEQGKQRFSITETLDDFVLLKRVPLPVYMLRKIQKYVAKNAACIIVPSEYLKRIVSSWKISHKKIKVIYNAIRVEGAGIVPEAVAHLSRPLIVSVGRLVPWKGMVGVIDAVALLRKRGVSASLAIVGDGPDYAALVAYAEKELQSEYVFTGALSHVATLATMKSASAFVLNSTYEGLAHILIEALTLSVPIVATRVGGNPEVIQHEENGLLIESGDTPGLVDALALVLTDTKLGAHLSDNALASAKHFSVETMIHATVTALREI